MKFLDRLQANFGSADLVDYSFRSTPRCCRPRLGMTATVCSELWPNNIWCTGSAAKPTAATAAAIDAKLSWRSSCAAFDVDVTRTYAVDVTDHNLLSGSATLRFTTTDPKEALDARSPPPIAPKTRWACNPKFLCILLLI